MLKIIHAADLHLDSPFSGLTPELAAQRRGEQRLLLEDLLALTVAEQAEDAKPEAGKNAEGEPVDAAGENEESRTAADEVSYEYEGDDEDESVEADDDSVNEDEDGFDDEEDEFDDDDDEEDEFDDDDDEEDEFDDDDDEEDEFDDDDEEEEDDDEK